MWFFKFSCLNFDIVAATRMIEKKRFKKLSCCFIHALEFFQKMLWIEHKKFASTRNLTVDFF